MTIQLLTESFDPGTELTRFMAERSGAGAVVTFTGVVRSLPDSAVNALTLECYPELAFAQLTDLEAQAVTRFKLLRTSIIHRYGRLTAGEPIVQVMTQSPHRHDAFLGAEYLMDYLKTDAAFWKKESTGSGEFWVDARPEDDQSRARWE